MLNVPRTAALAIAPFALVGPIPAAAKTTEFRTPSRNIHCLYSTSGQSGAFIRCDVRSLNDVGFLLEGRKRAKRIRITDTVADPRKARSLR